MKAAVIHPPILIVAPDNVASAESAKLLAHAAAAGFEAAVTTVAEATGWLKQAVVNGQEPLAVLIGPDVAAAKTVARDLRAVWSVGHLFFIDSDQSLGLARRDLSRAPMIGSHWSLARLDDPALPALIGDAARAAQRRMKLRTTLDRANVQLSARKPVDSLDYRRMALSEHYLTSFLAQAKDAIVSLDADLHVLYWNSGAERLFSVTASEALNLTASSLPFWSDTLGGYLARIQRGASSLTTEYACVLAEKELVIEVALSAVRDEVGKFVGTTMMIRDVSARFLMLEAERAATRAIDSERLRLLGLLDRAPGFTAIKRGPNHVYELVNQAYYQLVGDRELIGKPALSALPELAGQQFYELLDRVYATGEPFVGHAMPVSIRRTADAAPQQRFVDFVYQPVIEPDGTVSGVFCQGHDVTQQKIAQDALLQHQEQLQHLVAERTAELRAAEAALQQSQKLESLGKLTGGVAHDFNNILQVIAGNLELLQAEAAGNAAVVGRLKNAVAAVERGAKLSSQLLAFARRQPLQPVATNLGRIVRGMGDLLRRALGEAIEIETIVSGGLWNAMVDRNQLENVILNLAINARDAMNAEGKLTLEIGNAMLDDHYAREHAEVSPGQYVLLAISDTGSGMAPEIIARAFEPFFTTKPEGIGTGLGLSMVYGFVKQSGGHIKIYSEPGSGTTFKIYLPRVHQVEALLADIQAGPVMGGTETILVVEDDPAVQATVVDLLAGLGYKILKAKDGESALTVLRSGMSIDMLFTDVVMPGPVRSPELARQAKELLPAIAVLYTSGYTQNAIVHGGRLDPGVELISKPYRREDLARKIRHGLANRPSARAATAPEFSYGSAIVKTTEPRRILVVEDNPDSQMLLCELLNLLGHAAQGVASAEDALPLLETGGFDLLLTDMGLPGMSGMELATKATRANPALVVIFASGYAITDRTEFAYYLLPKPYNFLQVQQVLAKVS